MGPSERRQDILKSLCRKRYDTYDNLAREYGVSKRTIRYDIEYLMRFYPIEATRGHNGGIKVADGFYLYRDSKILTFKQRRFLEKLSGQLDDEDRDTLAGILSIFAQ